MNSDLILPLPGINVWWEKVSSWPSWHSYKRCHCILPAFWGTSQEWLHVLGTSIFLPIIKRKRDQRELPVIVLQALLCSRFSKIFHQSPSQELLSFPSILSVWLFNISFIPDFDFFFLLCQFFFAGQHLEVSNHTAKSMEGGRVCCEVQTGLCPPVLELWRGTRGELTPPLHPLSRTIPL